jgi:type IX secretion system PorP/SprF family membrane protein
MNFNFIASQVLFQIEKSMRKYVIALFFTVLFYGIQHNSKAQDPQFSQFYAAPLFLNPAFAGSTELTRIGANYRNQWPGINANFVTYSAYFDHYFMDYNSGVGLLLLGDRESNAGIALNGVSLQYAYNLRLTQNLAFRAGLEANYTWRSIDYTRLVFGDQLDFTGIVNDQTGEVLSGGNVSYFDMAAGGLLYSDRFWMGFAAHHILQPNQSFLGEDDPLPRKYSVHAGFKIPLPTRTDLRYENGFRERSLTPTVNYKMQGEFQQLDIGMYFTNEPLVLGLSYRGLPIQNVEGVANNESLIFILGYTMNGLNIGYSFDYTLSSLGIGTGGAHEVSISYTFFMGDPRKPPKNVRQIPCPKF